MGYPSHHIPLGGAFAHSPELRPTMVHLPERLTTCAGCAAACSFGAWQPTETNGLPRTLPLVLIRCIVYIRLNTYQTLSL